MRVFAFLLVLAGCSDDVDLTGVYRVDVSVGSSPCGADQPITTTPPFLKFEKMKFFEDFFAYSECTDEAGTDCTSVGGLLGGGLFEPIDDGWRGVTTSSSSSGTACLLGMAKTEATLKGKALVVESFEYADQVELPEAECAPEEAERRGDDMPCEAHARIEATRL